MIPGGDFTSLALTNTFRIPNDMPYTPLSQTVWGGVSIGDSSKGRLVKYWIISYDGSSINVKPTDGVIAFTLQVTGVTSLSLAFDNNMGLAIAYTKADGAYFYYFDSLTSKYITRPFIGVSSCRVCVDDPRSFYTSNSDVFLVYTLNNKVYYRKQRDRYDVETYIGDTTSRLLRIGQNIDNRFQIELGANHAGQPPTPIPQPRILDIEGTLFSLSAPTLISVVGTQPDLVSPTINSIYGDIYPMPVPSIVDITGRDVSLNAPTITFLSGSIYSQTAPVIDSFEGTIPLNKPILVSVEGTLVTFILPVPQLNSFEGTDALLIAPRLQGFEGQIYALNNPMIVSLEGEIPLSKPTMVSFEGTPVPLSAPILNSFEGVVVAISRPDLISFEGVDTQKGIITLSNDLIFIEKVTDSSDLLFFDQPT